MTLLLGALTIGLILSLLALGIYISYRVFDIADITVDGSITFGAAICAVLIVNRVNPLLATLAGFAGGVVAGTVTGILQAKFKINPLLSGILVMTGLYSVNLHVMGKSNIPLLSAESLTTWAERMGQSWFGNPEVNLGGWMVSTRDLVTLLAVLAMIVTACLGLYWFFRTELGTAMRASGDNPQMIRALGVNVERYRIMGLALSNGLVGIAGALLAQYQGFADAQMGIGMVVWGLASVIIGESLTGSRSLGLAIFGAVAGSILFRLLVAIALRWGLNPNDLKLVTALFVFAALVLPRLLQQRKRPVAAPLGSS
ncbi:MAG: ABC transporter permease [Verrucomicrobia bacterium]|nr:ABC transporter permease [Verrucomicrobiota bacterium]